MEGLCYSSLTRDMLTMEHITTSHPEFRVRRGVGLANSRRRDVAGIIFAREKIVHPSTRKPNIRLVEQITLFIYD